MTADESLSRFGLPPAAEHLGDIRALLADQAAKERAGDDREDDLAYLCCAQLFSHGLLEDVLVIWDAKNSGFDLHCSLDVQFLCGAGLRETKAYLLGHADEKAADALEYIEDCEDCGDFADFTPARHLARYRAYFQIDGPGH